jgi:hypothetical protein
MFRTHFRNATLYDPQNRMERRSTRNAVNKWMHTLSAGSTSSPPIQEAEPIGCKPTEPRSSERSLGVFHRRVGRDCRGVSTPVRLVASNPEDFVGQISAREASPSRYKVVLPSTNLDTLSEKLAAETLLSLGTIRNITTTKQGMNAARGELQGSTGSVGALARRREGTLGIIQSLRAIELGRDFRISVSQSLRSCLVDYRPQTRVDSADYSISLLPSRGPKHHKLISPIHMYTPPSLILLNTRTT